ncbi:GNAT family N-acetyltransferase [Paenibacillus tyrfis]|uniref:GNAT family N-acetyltransferase n=1 Tax=Paenibacillus tyrfis TaxID=1501230 RepID=UPI0035CD39BE
MQLSGCRHTRFRPHCTRYRERSAVAPRSTYRDLVGLYATNENPDQIWSLVCFYVAREFRGHGVMKQLLQAAVEHARQRGAALLKPTLLTPIPQAIVLWDLFRSLKSSALSRRVLREVDVT